jgi:hypothetical protein
VADPNAQFAIDIAASMPAGEVTIAQLDELTAKLMGGGKNADHFQRAIVQVSTALDAAKAATVAANTALDAGETKYRELERAAVQSAKAAERAGQKSGGVIPADLAAKAHAADSAVKAYATTLAGLEGEAKRTAAAETRLGSTLTNVRKLNAHVNTSLAEGAESMSKLRGVIGATGGPLGRLGNALLGPVQGFQELSKSMGAAGAMAIVGVAGVAALAAAVVALGAAAVAGTVAIAAWAVGLADSARSAGLARDAVEAMHPEVAALHGEIDTLTKSTGLGTTELSDLARQLHGAKVKAKDMSRALEAAALAEAALGKGGASDFIAEIKEGKRSVNALSREVQDKLGGVVAKKMLGLDAQSAQLKKNFGEIFSGLNIDPVLSAMKVLVDLFDKNTAAGATIKFLFETIFQPLIDQAEKAAQFAEAFFLGLLIGALKIYIGLKPAIHAIQELFGFEPDASLETTLARVTDAGQIMAGVIFGVAAAVATMIAAVLAIPAALFAAGYAMANLADIGINMMRSLASGITGAAGVVVDAIKNAISAAIKSAKSLLGIASPSKVFAELGEHTGAGFERGVDASAPDAQDALARMASPLAAQDAVAKPGAAPSAGASVSVSGNTFNFYDVKDAKGAATQWEAWLTRALEGDAAALGGEAAPAT